jgi:hypothetical protein
LLSPGKTCFQCSLNGLLLTCATSVSGDASYRGDVFKMADFLKSELESSGVTVRFADLGKHTLDGKELQLPPAILGSIGNNKNKRTVLLYAHYDVQPVCTHVYYICRDHRDAADRLSSQTDGTRIRSL